MLRAIHLHGALGAQFGPRFDLAADSPSDALRGLLTQLPGLRATLAPGKWLVVRGPLTARPVALGDIATGFGAHETELHIIPAIEGAGGRNGVVSVLLGVALIGVSFLIPPAAGVGLGLAQGALANAVLGTGISLALSGVSQMLSSTPRPDYAQRERLRSDVFSSPGLVAEPGTPWPVNFGRFEAGGVVASVGLYIEDVPV